MSVNQENLLKIPYIGGCVYTQCYCEENIWKLCDHIKQTDQLSQCFAVFVSNDIRQTPLFRSKFGKQSDDGFILWDYHVFLVYAPEDKEPLVYDFDTKDAFPCPLREYVISAVKSEKNLPKEFHRIFRVIPGKEYLEKFSSDRSAMRKPDGSWFKDPPAYPCILNADGSTNLEDMISMDTKRSEIGSVVNFETFQRLFLKNVIC